MIQIAIVEDHKLFREGLESMLESVSNIQVTASFNNGTDFLKALDQGLEVTVCLLDLSLPEISGLEVLKELKRQKKGPKVIVLSMHDDGNYIVQSVRQMASGYLLKNTDLEELVTAIKTVAEGKKYFNAQITELMLNTMASDMEEDQELSSREIEVLQLIAEGLTTKEIAATLFISNRTVETHRVNMMKKLHVKNASELIRKAIEQAWI